MTYRGLSPEWKTAFDLSVAAFKNKCLPIGCVIVDSQGTIISEGHARMVYGSERSNVTQHAEMEALSKIALPDLEQYLTLYTTIEPCPMCFGAINVARIAELRFGTYDPWAGSTDLANGNWYMRRKQIDIRPADVQFQQVMALFLVYAMGDLNSEFVGRWGLVVSDLKPKIAALRDSGFSTLGSTEVMFATLARIATGDYRELGEDT